MKKLEGTPRRAMQTILLLPALGTLAVPALAVALSGSAALSATWTALRVLALYALTALFLNLMTGSLRPLLVKVFHPRILFRVHNAAGLAGFSMALAHMLLVAAYGLWLGFRKLGPVTLYIFTVTTVAILLRKYMRRYWRAVHRLNYAVFAVALVHAFQIGTDVSGVAFLEVVLYVYAALAAAGFVYRVQLEIRDRLRKRSSTGAAGGGLAGD